ncbi:unnamed protein product [Didymodactylos carnosus]|nr:unnamed protein product [Didymodactylos carnosus]CAF4173650.1 unnamed protein product [Didymodactylos carnosus]
MMSTTLERTKTPNPFKQIDASLFLNEATRMKLKRLFNQLDTDKDGHLTYPQVKKCLPANMERAQETFFKVKIITRYNFSPMLWQLLDDIDFNHYREDMLEYIIEFDACERQSVYNLTQIISFEGLISIISSRTNNSNWFHIKRVYDEFLRFIPRSSSNSNALLTHISRLDYISYIPLFLYVESLSSSYEKRQQRDDETTIEARKNVQGTLSANNIRNDAFTLSVSDEDKLKDKKSNLPHPQTTTTKTAIVKNPQKTQQQLIKNEQYTQQEQSYKLIPQRISRPPVLTFDEVPHFLQNKEDVFQRGRINQFIPRSINIRRTTPPSILRSTADIQPPTHYTILNSIKMDRDTSIMLTPVHGSVINSQFVEDNSATNASLSLSILDSIPKYCIYVAIVVFIITCVIISMVAIIKK